LQNGREVEEEMNPPDPVVTLVERNDLWEALRAGSSAADLLRALETPAEREVLKRAALVSTFDEELFCAVLSADLPEGVPAAEFDQFVARSAIARVPPSDEIYSLNNSDRTR